MIIDDFKKLIDNNRDKFTDDEEYIEREIRQAGPHTLIFALVPEHMTGKLVNEA